MFSTLYEQIGLSFKVAKNEESSSVSRAGIEFATSSMVIPLPPKKLYKARVPVQNVTTCQLLSLLKIQQLTGYLSFGSSVVLLGRMFHCCFYKKELYFPPGSNHHRRHILGEAQKDLA